MPDGHNMCGGRGIRTRRVVHTDTSGLQTLCRGPLRPFVGAGPDTRTPQCVLGRGTRHLVQLEQLLRCPWRVSDGARERDNMDVRRSAHRRRVAPDPSHTASVDGPTCPVVSGPRNVRGRRFDSARDSSDRGRRRHDCHRYMDIRRDPRVGVLAQRRVLHHRAHMHRRRDDGFEGFCRPWVWADLDDVA